MTEPNDPRVVANPTVSPPEVRSFPLASFNWTVIVLIVLGFGVALFAAEDDEQVTAQHTLMKHSLTLIEVERVTLLENLDVSSPSSAGGQ